MVIILVMVSVVFFSVLDAEAVKMRLFQSLKQYHKKPLSRLLHIKHDPNWAPTASQPAPPFRSDSEEAPTDSAPWLSELEARGAR